jgi:hypothetical protein
LPKVLLLYMLCCGKKRSYDIIIPLSTHLEVELSFLIKHAFAHL